MATAKTMESNFMLNRKLLKSLVLIAGITTLAACGSDSPDDDVNNSSNNAADPGSGSDTGDNTDSTSGDTNTDSTPGDTNTGGDVGGNPALANPIPQIVTMACGDLPISETSFSNTEGAPSMMSVGEIVRGRGDPDAAANTQHYWSIDLQPGYYHVILDTRRVDDENRNIGLQLDNVKGPGEDDDLSLLALNEIGYTFRKSLFLEVDTAETLNLRLSSIFSAEDYTMGIFENGSAIPSPAMEECPSIQSLSLDSTQSIVLPSYDTDADDLWFQIELEIGDYILDSTTTRVDGANRNIIYNVRSVDHFGETDRFQEVSSVNEIDIMHSSSDVLTVSEDGLVWVRMRSGTAAQNIEFTLRRDN